MRVIYEKDRRRWSDVWLHNPRIAKPDERGDFQVLVARENYLRPYMVEKTKDRWTWKEFRPPRGEIFFNEQERDFGQRHAGRVILEPTIKGGASPNKQWPWMSWNKLAYILTHAGVRVTQVGPLGTRLLDGGVDHVVTNNFRLAAAVLANARAAVLSEGGLHHAAAAVGVSSVVIFGGFIAPAVTGYDSHVNLFTGHGLGCGMRVPCECCKAAMAAITPSHVANHLFAILSGERKLAIAE